jgi:hypothetical protein
MKPSIPFAVWLLAASGAAAQGLAAPMSVYGASVNAAGVTVRVPANACRGRSDFTVAVLKRDPEPMVLVAPKRPQACGPVQAGHTDLVYSLEELGLKLGESFVLGNPLTVEP